MPAGSRRYITARFFAVLPYRVIRGVGILAGISPSWRQTARIIF